MEPDQVTSKRSKKPLIVAAAVVIVLVVVAIAVYIAVGTPKEETAVGSDTTTKQQPVATNDEVQQNLKDLDATIKEATADQADAKASLKDGTNQIKVGN